MIILLSICLAIACIGAGGFIFANTKLGVVLFSSLFSFAVAVCYTILNSPDVALTEALLNVFITFALLLIVCGLLKNIQGTLNAPTFKISVFLFGLCFCLIFVVIFYILCNLGQVGEVNILQSPIRPVNTIYLQNSVKQTGVINVVTSTLASYRGFDTLLETFVIFLTSFCVLFVFGGEGVLKKTKKA